MADSKLLTFGLIGVGGYLAYRYFFATPAAVSSTTPPAGTSATPAAPSALDSIYASLLSKVGSQQLTADGFNVYLNQSLLPLQKTAPDPNAVFNAGGTWDRGATMTLPAYWAVMAPYLRSNLSLSGLGIFGGLGALSRGVRYV